MRATARGAPARRGARGAAAASRWSGTCSARSPTAATASSAPCWCAVTVRCSRVPALAACWRCREIDEPWQHRSADAWRCGSSRRATAASSRCSTARTSCSAVAERGRARATSSRPADDDGGTGPYDLSLVEGSITTAARRRAHPRRPRVGPRPLVTHRRLRHGRRHPGAAQLRRRRRVPLRRLRPRRSSSRPSATSTADRRPRAGRLRAARLPDRPSASCSRWSRVRCAGRAPGRAAPQRVRGVQAARQRVRDGRPRARRASGPVTHAGCGALCPTYAPRAATAASGPPEDPNVAALAEHLVADGHAPGATWSWPAAHLQRRGRGVPRPLRTGARRRHAARGRGTSMTHRAPAQPHHQGRSPGPRRGRGRACTWRSATARCTTCSCASTSRPGSSRRSCAGRRYTEPPDITARICGICPVAYQMSACAGDRGRRAA